MFRLITTVDPLRIVDEIVECAYHQRDKNRAGTSKLTRYMKENVLPDDEYLILNGRRYTKADLEKTMLYFERLGMLRRVGINSEGKIIWTMTELRKIHDLRWFEEQERTKH